ncbi:MAG: MFS transporter [Candidatus Xenobia bacterium]
MLSLKAAPLPELGLQVPDAEPRVPGLRWTIVLLLSIGIVASFFDRVNASVAEESMKHSFGMTDIEMGYFLSAYLWPYALLQIPIGNLMDRIGIKWLLRVGIVLWSVATYITAMAQTVTVLMVSRLLLGVAEAPIFPGAAKAVSLWFPNRERGVATCCFDASAKFSNVIGLPLVAFAVATGGWRGAFWFTGTFTLLFAVLFWRYYRDPGDHPKLSPREREYILAGTSQRQEAPVGRVRYLLRQPRMWALVLGFGAYGFVFYMFLSWLPGYLIHDLHMTALKGGMALALPWLVATITDVTIGGWLVDSLIERGHDSTRVRKGLFVAGMLVGLAVLGAACTRNPAWAIFWISISLGGLAFAAPIGWSLPGLIAPRGMVGTVGGVMNFACNLMGMAAPIVTGYIVSTTHSFAAAFMVATAVLLAGVLGFLALLGRVEPIPEPKGEA